MKIFNKQTFLTLNEAIEAYPLTISSPSVMSGFSVTPSGGSAVTAWDLFLIYAGDRYIAHPIEDATDAAAVNSRLATIANIKAVYYRPLYANLETMVAQLVADGESETLEYKRNPKGATNFASAFSDGGTIRQKTGGSSGNSARIFEYTDKMRNILQEYAEAVSDAFTFPVTVGSWGTDVEEV